MNPREAAILNAAATLLSTKQDVAYGPAHAVRDALEIEKEVSQQAIPGARDGFDDLLRKAGAL